MIRAIKNPFFLADTFVFETEGEKQGCFVMVNCKNKIENIGYSITRRLSMPKELVERFHPGVKTMYSLDEIIEKSEEPTAAQKKCFSIIDVELFRKLKCDDKRAETVKSEFRKKRMEDAFKDLFSCSLE